MSSSYFDIDDLPGPSNRRNTNREIYISAADSGYGASVHSDEDPHKQQNDPNSESSSTLLSPGSVPSMPNLFTGRGVDDGEDS